MDLERLPSSVLMMLAQCQLGELQLRKVLADALAATTGRREVSTRARHVASALCDMASGDASASRRLIAVLSIPTDHDEQLVADLADALSRALALGDHERADALRDALKDAKEGRLFWQSTVMGLLTGRLAPSVIPPPITQAAR